MSLRLACSPDRVWQVDWFDFDLFCSFIRIFSVVWRLNSGTDI